MRVRLPGSTRGRIMLGAILVAVAAAGILGWSLPAALDLDDRRDEADRFVERITELEELEGTNLELTGKVRTEVERMREETERLEQKLERRERRLENLEAERDALGG